MRTILSMIILGFIGSTVSLATDTNIPPKLVDDPVAAIKAILPTGWVIQEVIEDTYPSYRPKGNGKAVFLGFPRKQGVDEKTPYEAVVYFMPKEYKDGGEDPTHGQAQTWPAKLILTTDSAKIYLWGMLGLSASDWKNMKDDILKAIVKK